LSVEEGKSISKGDGKWLVTYIPLISGEYELNITLSDSTTSKQHINGSPFIVSVIPAKTCSKESLVLGDSTNRELQVKYRV